MEVSILTSFVDFETYMEASRQEEKTKEREKSACSIRSRWIQFLSLIAVDLTIF